MLESLHAQKRTSPAPSTVTMTKPYIWQETQSEARWDNLGMSGSSMRLVIFMIFAYLYMIYAYLYMLFVYIYTYIDMILFHFSHCYAWMYRT